MSGLCKPNSKIMVLHMKMIQILQNFIYAERARLWKVHLQQAQQMLPYMIVTGHHNYVT